MVDTRVAITLLMKKWVDDHRLTMREKAAKCNSGANGTVVWIMGTTSKTLLLVPTLELNVANVNICTGDFYQYFLDVIFCAGIMRCSVQLSSPCPVQTNKLPIVGLRIR